MSHALFFNPPLEEHFLGHQMSEIYKDRIYNPFLFGKKDLTIIDVGSNIGLTSYYFSQFGTVYALEPSTESYDLALQMLAYNGITNVHMIKKALYIEKGKFPLFDPTGKYDNRTMRSLHSSMDGGKVAPEMVDTITLTDLFSENDIKHVDLFKMDVEGSEYEIFGHTTFAEVADKIDVIVGETHAWAGRNPNQIRESLKSNGFSFEWQPRKDGGEPEMFIAKK